MTAIAHYNVLERLGETATGELFRARDTKVGRTVALKFISAEAFTDPATRVAFFEDARAAMALSHPNIATLFDVGEYEGDCYLAYEFASGITLRQECAGRSVNPRRVAELAVQIADALAEGHGYGILHADLRPDTIIVTHKGSAKLLEFGMSRWTTGGRVRAEAARAPRSLAPESVSVVSYMSPEQVLGGAVDPRTDIFSLGVITYEMLTGRNPFAAATAEDTAVNVIAATIPPAHSLSTSLDDLDALITRSMTKDIASRPQSAASFSAELRGIGAILDVRSGLAGPSELLPIEEDRSSSAKWWVAAAAGIAAGLAWWMFR
ncbi:MAG: serine/threonine-protein kinase [Vicinamibacterales bacterium]